MYPVGRSQGKWQHVNSIKCAFVLSSCRAVAMEPQVCRRDIQEKLPLHSAGVFEVSGWSGWSVVGGSGQVSLGDLKPSGHQGTNKTPLNENRARRI